MLIMEETPCLETMMQKLLNPKIFGPFDES